MFKIVNIKYGWFDFSLSGKIYGISYLSDIKQDLDKVFSLNFLETRYCLLDMESYGDLLIIAFRDSLNIYINIIEIDADDFKHESFRFDYDEFINSYLSQMESYKAVYLKEFLDPDDSIGYKWNSEDYLILKKDRRINIVERSKENMKKVYLAGPLFTREEQYQRKFDVSYLREHVSDYEFYSPLEVELSVEDPSITNAETTHDFYYKTDMEAINSSDLAIVDLAHDDNGTLVELGIFKGLGKPYIIINSDFRLCESNGMHRNSFVRGIEKEALLVASDIMEVAEFLQSM